MKASLAPGGSLLAIIKRDWKNPPNLVTGVRMIGALGIPALVISPSRRRKLAGAGLFVALAATDKLDGWMAKNVYGSTELGKMLDPAVDKELILLSLGSVLVDSHRRKDRTLVGALLIALPVLAVREVAVARIKMDAQRTSGAVESAIQSGRVSMLTQSAAVGALLIPTNSAALRRSKLALLATAVGASLYSWRDYHKKYRGSPS